MTAAPIIRIVDDDPNIHDALAYVLENEGFIVRTTRVPSPFSSTIVRKIPAARFSTFAWGKCPALFCMTG